MAAFQYVVVDKNGKEKKGSMEASTEEKVMTTLKAEGNIVLSVSVQNAWNKDINITLGSGVKPRDLCVFCRQFVSILSAGVTVISALEMLSEQTENKVMGGAIKEVQIAVEKGETLADAFRVHSKVFPSILVNMVEAGEASGSLELAFERMSTHFEKDAKLKALVQKAMIYPAVICVVAVGVIFAMMLFVIPNFMGMFAEMDMEMPAITVFVINMSDFFLAKWYLIIGGAVAFIVAIKQFRATAVGRNLFGRMELKLPLFGPLTVKSSSARFARTISTLVMAGVPLIDAIDITARTMDNVIVKDALLLAKDDVSKGLPLSHQIRACGLFPPMVYHMTHIGEETGNLEGMLDRMADYYDEEVENATQALTTALEPMIIVVLALIVGVIIMAILQPMLTMYEGIENL